MSGVIIAVLVYVAIQTVAINNAEPAQENPQHMYIDLDTGEQWVEGEQPGGVMLQPAEEK